MNDQHHTDRREQLLVELLRLAADPHSHAAAWEGVRGTGNAIPIRPHEPRCHLNTAGLGCTCWLRSLDELHRCLRLMRKTQRPLWYAVTERYVMADRRPRTVLVRHGHPRLEPNQQQIGLVNRADLNKRGDGTTRILVETWRPGIRADRVRYGLEWLSDTFGGPLELPVERNLAAA